jgi:hypothetical protein
MSEPIRMIALGGTIGLVVAGTLVAPQFLSAVADEQVAAIEETIETLFPPQTVDPRAFRRFDITLADSVSTTAERTTLMTRIAFGRKTTVAVVETPTGTYSSDAITSVHVRYPGIEVTPKRRFADPRTPRWSAVEHGSFTYYSYSLEPAG